MYWNMPKKKERRLLDPARKGKGFLPALISFPWSLAGKSGGRRRIGEGSPAMEEEISVVGGFLMGIGECGICCVESHELGGRVWLVLESHNVRVTSPRSSSVSWFYVVWARTRRNPQNLVKRRRCSCRCRHFKGITNSFVLISVFYSFVSFFFFFVLWWGENTGIRMLELYRGPGLDFFFFFFLK